MTKYSVKPTIDYETRLRIAEAKEKSDQAEQLLANRALQEAFERLDSQYTEAWKNSDPLDGVLRETIYFRQAALNELKADLQAVAKAGQITEFNLRSRIRAK